MKEEIISTGHVGAGVMTLTNRTRTPVTQLFIDCAREVATRSRHGDYVPFEGRLATAPGPVWGLSLKH